MMDKSTITSDSISFENMRRLLSDVAMGEPGGTCPTKNVRNKNKAQRNRLLCPPPPQGDAPSAPY